jgi:hypothetical protein
VTGWEQGCLTADVSFEPLVTQNVQSQYESGREAFHQMDFRIGLDAFGCAVPSAVEMDWHYGKTANQVVRADD